MVGKEKKSFGLFHFIFKVPSGRIVWIVKALDNGLVVLCPELSVACFAEMWKKSRAQTGHLFSSISVAEV